MKIQVPGGGEGGRGKVPASTASPEGRHGYNFPRLELESKDDPGEQKETPATVAFSIFPSRFKRGSLPSF